MPRGSTTIYLGGAHNFAADRALAEPGDRRLAGTPGDHAAPTAPSCAGRCSSWCDCGVRQFLDLGAGLADRRQRASEHRAGGSTRLQRVVCVDIDPVAVSHGRAHARRQPAGLRGAGGSTRIPRQCWRSSASAGVDLDRGFAGRGVAGGRAAFRTGSTTGRCRRRLPRRAAVREPVRGQPCHRRRPAACEAAVHRQLYRRTAPADDHAVPAPRSPPCSPAWNCCRPASST